jgi:DNA-binding NarL/FixJ family response regulator
LNTSDRAPKENDGDPRLTRREWEVLRLVAKGYTYREVTDMLAVGSRTVRTQVRAILKKLQLRRRSELVRWYATHKDDGRPE